MRLREEKSMGAATDWKTQKTTNSSITHRSVWINWVAEQILRDITRVRRRDHWRPQRQTAPDNLGWEEVR